MSGYRSYSRTQRIRNFLHQRPEGALGAEIHAAVDPSADRRHIILSLAQMRNLGEVRSVSVGRASRYFGTARMQPAKAISQHPTTPNAAVSVSRAHDTPPDRGAMAEHFNGIRGKELLREQLQRDMAAFEAARGIVQVLDWGDTAESLARQKKALKAKRPGSGFVINPSHRKKA